MMNDYLAFREPWIVNEMTTVLGTNYRESLEAVQMTVGLLARAMRKKEIGVAEMINERKEIIEVLLELEVSGLLRHVSTSLQQVSSFDKPTAILATRLVCNYVIGDMLKAKASGAISAHEMNSMIMN